MKSIAINLIIHRNTPICSRLPVLIFIPFLALRSNHTLVVIFGTSIVTATSSGDVTTKN